MSLLYDIMHGLGRRAARDLRAAANDMTGTEIIDSEHCIPDFDPEQDYSDWPPASPVADEGQVWVLITPHNAKNYEGRPSTLRALWWLTHTKDPKRAKPWVDPYGISGLYMTGECYMAEDGTVYRCKQDDTCHNAEDLPGGWEIAV